MAKKQNTNEQEEAQALVPVQEHTVQVGSLEFSTEHVIARASTIATQLASIIQSKGLSKTLGGNDKPYVLVDAWTALGGILGVTAMQVPALSHVHDDGTCEEWVELVRNNDGKVIGRAKGLCGSPDEPKWSNRAKYARTSMAATRATAKAFRQCFSWIMVLAGYSSTPYEEMQQDTVEGQYRDAEPQEDKVGKARAKILELWAKAKKYREDGNGVMNPAQLKAFLGNIAIQMRASNRFSASEKQRKLLVMVLSETFGGDEASRHAFTNFIFGKESAKSLDGSEVNALLDWLQLSQEGDGFVPSAESTGEAITVVSALEELQEGIQEVLESEDELAEQANEPSANQTPSEQGDDTGPY